MLLNKNKGFTLIEVLVAVAILGFVATGSLRLMIIASKSLIVVEETRELLNEARVIQLEFLTDKTKPTSGKKDDYKWDTREGSWPVLDGNWELKYKELRIEKQNNEIVLYIPNY
jgi:prepilin-type N-terminal cleavage/methylation domain-containing protein